MHRGVIFPSLLASLIASWSSQAAVYQEVGGGVVVEGEHFDARTTATDNDHHFVLAPDELSGDDASAPVSQYLNARGGKYIVNLPDSPGGGENRNNPDAQEAGPTADYKVEITTTGEYTLYVRDTGYDGSSDSCYFQILELRSDRGGPGPNWYRYAPTPADGDFDTDRHDTGAGGWDNQMTPEANDAGGAEVAAVWTISKPGTYTIRYQQREDGNALDAICLQLSSLPPPSATIAESQPVGGGTPQPLTITSLIPADQSTAARFTSPITVVFANGTNQLATNSITLQLDGATVTPSITQNGDTVTVTYQPDIFAPQSAHSATISYSDTTGAKFTKTWSFTVQNYVVIPAAWAVNADTTKPGFIWNMSQVDSVGDYAQNSNARTEAQLAGLLGDNVADASVAGVASGPGKPGPNSTDPFEFEIPTVINVDRNAADFGHFTPADQMPGSPGIDGGTDNQAAEVLTFLQLPAGPVTMGVTSDDGFRVTAGPNARDAFAVRLGEFDGGRGAADTLFTFVVEKAGIYPFRLIWENGGGDSRVAWFSVNNKTNILINDANNPAAIKAYSTGPGGTTTYVKSVSPVINAPAEAGTNGIQVVIVGSTVDTNSIKLTLDAASIPASITRSGDTTTITYTPTTALPGGTTHTIGLSFGDTSNPSAVRNETWQFTTMFTPADLPANSFWIEAEDFNNNGQDIASASTMPYLGGAYQGLGGTLGIDFRNNDNPADSQDYRDYSTGDLANDGTSVNITDNGSNRFSVERPGGVTMSVNYRIGWVDSGEWYDYTRTIPAGNYNAYFAMSSGSAGDNMGASLALVTSDPGTTNQTTTALGTGRQIDDGAGWGNNLLFPMRGTDGSLTSFSLPGGKTTLRVTTIEGDFDWFALTPAATNQPPVGGNAQFTSVTRSGDNLVLAWTGGVLESADDLGAAWTPVQNATSPATIPMTGSRKFFRVR